MQIHIKLSPPISKHRQNIAESNGPPGFCLTMICLRMELWHWCVGQIEREHGKKQEAVLIVRENEDLEPGRWQKH